MYKSVVRCVKTYIVPNEKIDFIISLDNLKTMPNRMRTRVLPFIRECVDNAMAKPFEVTQSVHWYEPGTTPPATQPVTEVETVKATESIEKITETLAKTINQTQAPETEKNTTMLGKSNTGLIIVIVCGITAVVAVSVILVIAKKKKK